MCQSIAGPPVDEAIGMLVAEQMTPPAVELALELRKEIQARHEEADRLRCRAIERAQTEACRYRINTPQMCRLNCAVTGLPGRAPEDRSHVITDTTSDCRKGDVGDQARGDDGDLGFASTRLIGVGDRQADRRGPKDCPTSI
uniref:Transposase n=1 Tax=Rhizobium meliloti TaxID=382 RepID=I2E1M7_RHIML|nr:transposase [Sinorhizobium meliloti]